MSTEETRPYAAAVSQLAKMAANRDVNKKVWIQKKFEQFDIIREGLEEIETTLSTRGTIATKSMRIRDCLKRIETEVVSLRCDVSVLEYTRAKYIFTKSIEANRPLIFEMCQLFEKYLGEKKGGSNGDI